MRFSAPPMIIFMDVLFVVLFLLTFEESPNIKIILPQKNWLKDTIVVSENEHKQIKHWFNIQTKSWETFDTFPKRENRKYSFIIGRLECEGNTFCSSISSIPNETKKIYVTGDLYDQLSGLIADSCLAFPRRCSSVAYHITDEGIVDTKRLKDEFEIFTFILKPD
jgi:hypothetical protein